MTLGLALLGCPRGPDPNHGVAPPPAADPERPLPAGPAAPEGVEAPEPRPAAAILEAVVRARALRRDEPWALAHAMLVSPPDLRLPDGTSAADALVLDHLQRAPLRFPRERDGRPIEPHPGLFTKTLLELGLPLERRFGDVTLRDLVLAHARAYEPHQGTPTPFKNEAWLLECVAAAADLDPTLATRREQLAAATLAVLAENQAYFAEFEGATARRFEKATEVIDGRRVPAAIHRYFCGGLHFFQAVQRLHGPACPPPLTRQYELLRVRMEREARYWDEALARVRERFQGDEARRHVEVVLAQQLKLLGHALEAYYRGLAAGAPDGPAVREHLARARGDLERAVLALDGLGIYADLDAIRRRAPQLYLDLVGDSAHALHALQMAERAAGRN